MGIITRTFESVRNVTSFAPITIPSWQTGQSQITDGKYRSYADEGYQKNEIVFACIDQLARSASDPRLIAKVGGVWRDSHPILDLMQVVGSDIPRTLFWKTVILHLSLAGNAYGLIVRSRSGRPLDIWLMRPDYITVIPSTTGIAAYRYDIGDGKPVDIPKMDVIHFRTANPLNEFYGQSPLMAAAGRVDIDNFMRDFVKTYFNKAGVPGGLLSLKGKISPDVRTEIKERFKDDYGGPSGWHKLLVIDQDASFTPMTSNLGASGLVIPELDKVSTRRICTVFGVPPSLVGLDDSNTSYASLEMIQRFFWDNTLAPLYKDLAATLNLRLTPNFPGVSEVKFDLADVAALQEDVDEVHARERADMIAGGITVEEFRLKTGRGPLPKDGTLLIPASNTPVPVADVVAGRASEVINPPPAAPSAPAVPA